MTRTDSTTRVVYTFVSSLREVSDWLQMLTAELAQSRTASGVLVESVSLGGGRWRGRVCYRFVGPHAPPTPLADALTQ